MTTTDDVLCVFVVVLLRIESTVEVDVLVAPPPVEVTTTVVVLVAPPPVTVVTTVLVFMD